MSTIRHVKTQLVSGVQRAATPSFPTRPSAAAAATRALDDCCGLDFMLRRECADFDHELFHNACVGFLSYLCKAFLFDMFARHHIVLFFYVQ
jgi:hypothetical protein